jgi:hypothetical protein
VIVATIDINRRPSPAELRVFGFVLLGIFVVAGAVLRWRFDSSLAAGWVWGCGLGLAALYAAVRPIRLPLYLAWMHAVRPLAWVVSHLALGLVYFAIITPIGLVMRLAGRDALARRFDRGASSYWIARDSAGGASRYFRQS